MKIHPELRRGFEVDRQPDCQIGADPELAFHKLLDLGFRPFRGHGQVHDSHAQRFQQAIETVSPASYNYQGMALQKSAPTPDYVSINAFDIVCRLIPQNKTMRRKGKGTELRNQTLKSDSRKLAHQTMSMDPEALAAGVDPLSLRIDPITPLAINAYHQWSGPIGFPWEAVLDWKTKDAKGLDLALWYEEELCGLCYATPRRSTICMKIVLLQGHTCKTNTLRGWIAPMALLTTEFYARKLGCTQIEVQEPDSGAIPYYQTLGFYFDTTGRLSFHWTTNKIESSVPAPEVFMKQKKQKAQPARVSKSGIEALGLPDRVSASQQHFLKVAATYGKEMEPDGWLAGGGT